jgi:hypothetical protein
MRARVSIKVVDHAEEEPLSFLAIPAKYFPWWKACCSSSWVGTLDPSPATVPAP